MHALLDVLTLHRMRVIAKSKVNWALIQMLFQYPTYW